jgi:hypothetical protein
MKYELKTEEREKLFKDFTYHPPLANQPYNQPQRYTEIRDRAGLFAVFLFENCPRSRELSLAITKTEEAVFWANAAIARNEKE